MPSTSFEELDQAVDVTEVCHCCGEEIEMETIIQDCTRCAATNVACHGCAHWEYQRPEFCADCSRASNFMHTADDEESQL